MDPTLTQFLFTSAGTVGILGLGATALVALPWTIADQAGTARGLERIAASLKAEFSGVLQAISAHLRTVPGTPTANPLAGALAFTRQHH
jgi:hypothetical protein